MIAINSEYNSFGHVHFDAILQRNDCSARAVEIIKALINRGVKKYATGFLKFNSAFKFSIFGCYKDRWECAQGSLCSRRLTRTFVEKSAYYKNIKAKVNVVVVPQPASPTVRNCIIFSVVRVLVVSGHGCLCLGRLNCRFSTGIFFVKPR